MLTLKIFLIFGRVLEGQGFVVMKLLYACSQGEISSILKLLNPLMKTTYLCKKLLTHSRFAHKFICYCTFYSIITKRSFKSPWSTVTILHCCANSCSTNKVPALRHFQIFLTHTTKTVPWLLNVYRLNGEVWHLTHVTEYCVTGFVQSLNTQVNVIASHLNYRIGWTIVTLLCRSLLDRLELIRSSRGILLVVRRQNIRLPAINQRLLRMIRVSEGFWLCSK